MKHFLFFTLFSLLLTSLIAQEEKSEKYYSRVVHPGVGFKIGIFYPSDVNKYITSYFDIKGVKINMGTSDLILNLVPEVSLSIRPSKRFEIFVTGEYGISPKFVAVTNGENEYFSFNRASLGVLGNIHMFVGKKNTFFVGAGVLYNSLTFTDPDEKKFTGSCIGGRIQGGFSLILGQTSLQPNIGIDFIETDGTSSLGKINLNYSGFHFGVNFNF